jgi:hypothetical protein
MNENERNPASPTKKGATEGESESLLALANASAKAEPASRRKNPPPVYSNENKSNGVSGGLILKTGRVRLPDKLMEYLNNEVAPDALYWLPGRETFALDMDKVQEQLLNKFFSKTKSASFLRSVSRWWVNVFEFRTYSPTVLYLDLHFESFFPRGFRRVFYHSLSRSTYAFSHPLFKKDEPHLEKDMKLVFAPSRSKKAKKSNEDGASAMHSVETADASSLAATLSSNQNDVYPRESLTASLTETSTAPASLLQTIALSEAQRNSALGQVLLPASNSTNAILRQPVPPANPAVMGPDLSALQSLITAEQQRGNAVARKMLQEQIVPQLMTSQHQQGTSFLGQQAFLQSMSAPENRNYRPSNASPIELLLQSAIARQQREQQQQSQLPHRQALQDFLNSLQKR